MEINWIQIIHKFESCRSFYIFFSIFIIQIFFMSDQRQKSQQYLLLMMLSRSDMRGYIVYTGIGPVYNTFAVRFFVA